MSCTATNLLPVEKSLEPTNLKVLNHRLSPLMFLSQPPSLQSSITLQLPHPGSPAKGNHFGRAVQALVVKWRAHRTVTTAVLVMDGWDDRMTGWKVE